MNIEHDADADESNPVIRMLYSDFIANFDLLNIYSYKSLMRRFSFRLCTTIRFETKYKDPLLLYVSVCAWYSVQTTDGINQNKMNRKCSVLLFSNY